MTKSNRTSQAKEGKGITTLALVKKETPQIPKETDIEYRDRIRYSALMKLIEKKNKTPEEQKEHDELYQLVGVAQMYGNGGLPTHFVDKDLKEFSTRIHEEFTSFYGADTPIKKLLINRITSAWNMSQSYERLFGMLKYEKNEDGTYTSKMSHERTGLLKEVRRGMESSNNQLLRLSQSLQNIVQPAIQVKATNAFFAQNQQVNQSPPPKDLDKISGKNND